MIYEPMKTVQMTISMTNIDELFVCFLSFLLAKDPVHIGYGCFALERNLRK